MTNQQVLVIYTETEIVCIFGLLDGNKSNVGRITKPRIRIYKNSTGRKIDVST